MFGNFNKNVALLKKIFVSENQPYYITKFQLFYKILSSPFQWNSTTAHNFNLILSTLLSYFFHHFRFLRNYANTNTKLCEWKSLSIFAVQNFINEQQMHHVLHSRRIKAFIEKQVHESQNAVRESVTILMRISSIDVYFNY